MKALAENIRKVIRFFLAAFFWSHALFLLNLHSAFISGLARLLRLTTSEVVLFILLAIFSFLAGSGFWKTVGNFAYLFFFPFVLLFYACCGCVLLLSAMSRWFNPQPKPQVLEVEQHVTSPPLAPAVHPLSPDNQVGARRRAADTVLVLLRPLRKFTLLWCFLLLVTTHTGVLWLSLIVVLLHLARTVFRVVKVTLFSGTWLARIEAAIRSSVETNLAKLAFVTPESAPTSELKNLLDFVHGLETSVRFLENRSLFSTWTWLFCGVFLVSVHVYLAFLFSIAYFGIARTSGVLFSWPESLVTSLFIPFFVSTLPKVVGIRLLGGFHCILIVSIGVGVVRYFRRRLESIRTVATIVSVQLADESIRKKYSILQEKFAASVPGATNPDLSHHS